MGLNEKIRALRVKSGKSQETLAESLNVSRQAVTKWELGSSSPDLLTLVALSEVFGVSTDYLLKDGACNSRGNISVENNNRVDEMVDFLLKAKVKTYAGKGPLNHSSRPSSYDLKYQEGDWLYLDTYLGNHQFSGQEAVWHDEKPLWALNYSGRVLDKEFSGDFLKDALKENSRELPYRGPNVFQKGAYTYHFILDGDLNWFEGYEEILYNGKRVYECRIHGGSIVDV
jgi:transcriptional regulator with XRE-family HTH domain